MKMWQKLAILVATPLVLAACGGGGGGNGTCLASGGCGNTSSSSTSSSSSSEATTAYGMTLETMDTASGLAVNPVTSALVYGKPFKLSVTVTNPDKTAAAGVVVVFTTDDTTNSQFTPSSGKALTDVNGKASITLSATTPSASGAMTIKAAAGTASVSQNYSINSTSGTGTVGTPSYLQYVGASTTRLFISGSTNGINNAAEQTIVQFKVLDSSNNPVKSAQVIYSVTKRNGGILTNGSASDVTVTSNDDGIASVTVTSGTEPLTFNVIGKLVVAPAKEYYSNDQIVITGSRPDQSKFFLMWDPTSPCALGSAPRNYPCKFTVTVGDIKGNPVADGTVVNFVSYSGVVVATTLAGQPSGACLTVNSQCTANYTGRPDIIWGYHRIVGYTVGNNAPTNSPITDGSSTIIVNTPDSDNYIRYMMSDASSSSSSAGSTP
ncbi:MAG: Ig-like domain-containing protein [Rhodocyclaceae bacterium]